MLYQNFPCKAAPEWILGGRRIISQSVQRSAPGPCPEDIYSARLGFLKELERGDAASRRAREDILISEQHMHELAITREKGIWEKEAAAALRHPEINILKKP